MSKVIDVREGGGELVVLGRAVVLPASVSDGSAQPLDGSIRFNPDAGIVEVYSNDAWGPVATAADGSPISYTITNITGLQAALDSKAPVAHTHVMADITDLALALSGKAALAHTHVTSDVTGLDGMLANLQTGIDGLTANKADKLHSHTVFQVTGLQSILDAKSNVGHTHSVNDIGDLAGRVQVFSRAMIDTYVAGTLPLGIVRRFVAVAPITIPQNMSGSRGVVTGAPLTPIILDVKVNGSSQGSIVIAATTGFFSFTTNSPLGIIMIAGDVLTIEAAAADTHIQQITINLLAVSN
jgi:hypothetical protein